VLRKVAIAFHDERITERNRAHDQLITAMSSQILVEV